jgi:hypothetical protein
MVIISFFFVPLQFKEENESDFPKTIHHYMPAVDETAGMGSKRP